jgi:hypothetical protein
MRNRVYASRGRLYALLIAVERNLRTPLAAGEADYPVLLLFPVDRLSWLVTLALVGPGREQTILLKNPFKIRHEA